jgi:hypothetical protein
MQSRQQAKELQRHGDHQQPGEDRENPLTGVKRTAQQRDCGSLRRAYDLAEGTRESAKKAVGRQSTGIVHQMAQDRRAASQRIAAQRTSKPAAHPDAVKTACEPCDEDHEIGGHRQIALPIQRL